jgi:hypothetical protein
MWNCTSKRKLVKWTRVVKHWKMIYKYFVENVIVWT